MRSSRVDSRFAHGAPESPCTPTLSSPVLAWQARKHPPQPGERLLDGTKAAETPPLSEEIILFHIKGHGSAQRQAATHLTRFQSNSQSCVPRKTSELWLSRGFTRTTCVRSPILPPGKAALPSAWPHS